MQTTRMEPTRIQDPKQDADRHTTPERLRPVIVSRPAAPLLPLPPTSDMSLWVMMMVVFVMRRRIKGMVVVVVVAVWRNHKHWE